MLYWDENYSKGTMLLSLFYISKSQYVRIFHNKHNSYPNYGNNEDSSLVKRVILSLKKTQLSWTEYFTEYKHICPIKYR